MTELKACQLTRGRGVRRGGQEGSVTASGSVPPGRVPSTWLGGREPERRGGASLGALASSLTDPFSHYFTPFLDRSPLVP